jgi:hypothetical protein
LKDQILDRLHQSQGCQLDCLFFWNSGQIASILDFSKAQDIVAEPSELFRLKRASHRYTGDHNSTHFKRNNPLVCRVTARYNHGSTGSKQVYLAWRRVYNHAIAHQLLVHRISKHYYKLFQK